MLLATIPLPLVSGPPQNLSAQSTWAAAVIATAEQRGLTMLNPQLNVHSAMSRGAVIESMVELAGLSGPPAPNRFSDLPASHPYAHAILVASQLGLITGDSGKTTVRPDDPISRAEVAVMLIRLQGLNRSPPSSVLLVRCVVRPVHDRLRPPAGRRPPAIPPRSRCCRPGRR